MFGINPGARRGRIVAIVDIGSTSAAVAIVAADPHGPPSIIAVERAQLSIEERTQEATITGIGEVLTTAGSNVQKKYAVSMQKNGGAVQELFVIMHAPWSSSKTLQANTTFKEHTLISDRMISDLSKKALGESANKDLLEASVIRVEINGYPSPKPVGKHAQEILVHVLVSNFLPGIREEIEKTLEKIFPHISPVFRSATRVAITVLREGEALESDYLLVDVESEGTTLTAVRHGVASEHELAPLGLQTILKKVAGSGMPEETLSLMRMIARDQCADSACETVLASMGQAEPDLVRIFGEAMAKCAAVRRLPDTMVLIAHPNILPWLSKLFSRIDFAQFTLTAQPFILRKLNTAQSVGSIQADGGIIEDPGLALAVTFVSIE